MHLPARIGKYEMEEFLGGGMSHVYRARDTVIGRTVAVKFLTETGCEDAETKARFLAEARVAGNLAHDNVLRIYDFGQDEQGRPFMVMEFLRGEDLRHAMKNGNTGDLKSKLKIALQVARALGYIHTQKIIHRDIKPENIHINSSGVVKLMDFGIAKTEGLDITRAGYVLGTPYYMSPEQVTGQNITEQVDVYAFGILLFELLTGTKPISGDAVERIFYHILNEPLNLDPLHQAGVPQAICDLIERCTAKSPAGRPRGFGPVCGELERVIGEQEAPTVMLPAMPVAAPHRPAVPRWLLPVVLLIAAAAALGLYFVSHTRNAPRPAGPLFATRLETSTGQMLLVPAGTFLFGEEKKPVDLPAFYVDRTEVTNAAYARFCAATGHTLPQDFPVDRPNYPVVNVSILEARDFAKWAGKRLPTGREWEKAARGTDGRLFPWGNARAMDLANVAHKGVRPVTDFPNGASPCGALQMVGNVWELVDQLSTPGPTSLEYFGRLSKILKTAPPRADEPWYSIRGYSFHEEFKEEAQKKKFDDVLWDSGTVPARWKELNIGFRCVKDPT